MPSRGALAALYDPAMAVAPFDGRNPVCIGELSALQIAWRTILHLLAEQNARITLPAEFFTSGDRAFNAVRRLLDDAPGETLTLPAALFSTMDIAVAAGWLYTPAFTFHGGKVTVGCRFHPRHPGGGRP